MYWKSLYKDGHSDGTFSLSLIASNCVGLAYIGNSRIWPWEALPQGNAHNQGLTGGGMDPPVLSLVFTGVAGGLVSEAMLHSQQAP